MKPIFNYYTITLFLFVSLTRVTIAQEGIIISDIRVEGLQRISAGTVFNYLPVRVGDRLTEDLARESIRALFNTGFFKDVQLEQDGDVLVVAVQERASIAQLDFIGNKEFDNDELTEALSQLELTQGRIFNQSVLDRAVQELKAQYFAVGKYAIEINTTVTPLDRNRVGIAFDIDEGKVAKIKQIRILGNVAFDEDELLDEFQLSTESVLNFFSKKDRYSKQKLEADLEVLRSFYQNNGYLDFEVRDTQVTISPDKEDIFITLSITEGEQYTLEDFSVIGDTVFPVEELESLVTIEKGEIYSLRDITESRAAIGDLLANAGYAFANVNPVPDINPENKTVNFRFVVEPGQRVYVRLINISGNEMTRDDVIRREFRQFEGSWYSAEKIRRSRERVNRLDFFESVTIETPLVPGTTDQVDINVNVRERATGSFLFGVGFSDADGLLLQLSVKQKNLKGTGKELDVDIDNSEVTDRYSIRFTNPYHTINGISRGFELSKKEVDASQSTAADYLSDTLSGGIIYKFPLTEFNSLRIGVFLEQVDLLETANTPDSYIQFIERHPSNDNLKVDSSFAYDSRDSLIYTTKGSLRQVSVVGTVPGSDVEFYKARLKANWHSALSEKLVFKISGEVGFGDSFGDTLSYPFYENFFAGGSSTVRGYDSRSLGPRDLDSGDPLGGSKRILLNTELLLPFPGAEETRDKRIALFIDGGMVYGDPQSVDLSELRYSAGVAFNWFSPVGPLSLSYAFPLNDEPGDDIQKFQISLGTFFR